MTLIEKADRNHSAMLSQIASKTFLESHGHSAKEEDISSYISEKYSPAVFKEELLIHKNNYYLIFHAGQLAGFSNIVFNEPHKNAELFNIAKLERIYVLKDFYDLKLGFKLLEFNINLAMQNTQRGMWLFVWKENQRAINFYQKNGFVVIGSYDFKISETHSNPNHLMLLEF